MTSAIKITGARSLAQALERLPQELAKNAETTALREGMKPVLAKARASAPTRTGQLKKSLGLTVRKGKRGANAGQFTARVGPRGGFAVTKDGKRIDPVKYAHLVELGTSRMPAKPFIRPAVESSEEAMMAGMAAGYEKGISKAVAKLRKK